jgi:hypothetical protein
MEPLGPSTGHIWGDMPIYSVLLYIFFKFSRRGDLLPGSSRSAAIERERERDAPFQELSSFLLSNSPVNELLSRLLDGPPTVSDALLPRHPLRIFRLL